MNYIFLKHVDPQFDTIYAVILQHEDSKRWKGICCGATMIFEKHLYTLTDEKPAWMKSLGW